VVITLWALHAWASILVFAAIFITQPSPVLAQMFSTAGFGIGMTLAILLLDRAADAVLARFAIPAGPPPAEVKETVTRTVTTSQGEENA
jgi:hypothetical protein